MSKVREWRGPPATERCGIQAGVVGRARGSPRTPFGERNECLLSRLGVSPIPSAPGAGTPFEPSGFLQETVAEARHDFDPEEIGAFASQTVTTLGARAIAPRGSSRDLVHAALRRANPERRKTVPGICSGGNPPPLPAMYYARGRSTARSRSKQRRETALRGGNVRRETREREHARRSFDDPVDRVRGHDRFRESQAQRAPVPLAGRPRRRGDRMRRRQFLVSALAAATLIRGARAQ